MIDQNELREVKLKQTQTRPSHHYPSMEQEEYVSYSTGAIVKAYKSADDMMKSYARIVSEIKGGKPLRHVSRAIVPEAIGGYKSFSNDNRLVQNFQLHAFSVCSSSKLKLATLERIKRLADNDSHRIHVSLLKEKSFEMIVKREESLADLRYWDSFLDENEQVCDLLKEIRKGRELEQVFFDGFFVVKKPELHNFDEPSTSSSWWSLF